MARRGLFVLVSALLVAIGQALFSVDSLESLSFNVDNRLDSHILLVHGDDACRRKFDRTSFSLRTIYEITDDAFAASLVPGEHSCFAVCVERGTRRDHVLHPLQSQIFVDHPSVLSAIHDNCQSAEIGFVSYLAEDATVLWISDEDGSSHAIGTLSPGEQKTFWLQSFLGHRLQIVDKNDRIVKDVVVEFNSIIPIGSYASHVRPRDDVKDIVRQTFESEWQRSNRVVRTYTEFGFAKGKLPVDVFASMSSYYYNNRKHATIEEWDGKGVFVNWWEADVFFVAMPFELKRYWQSRLKELVEDWVGVDLELTDIYGMRRYEDGARLLTHVDREATHATSLIVNVAQGAIRKPWKIEIYDFAHRLHEIEMDEGDIVFYESARCLHGRMQPLEGAYYVNLFAHYRPVGDPKWFLKRNPAGNVPQVLDLGSCAVEGASVHCEKHETPYLSPKMETLRGAQDLYRFWEQTTPQTQALPSGKEHTEL